ncbi:MAG: hypothetical protein JNM40_10545 [Myxococcales bacterium]|nr:hypothetical protein [Myxococcales bacterium]
MQAIRRVGCALVLPFLLAAESKAPDEGRAILAERDALIQKIAAGEDYERSVTRFIELKKRFDKLVVELKLKPDGAPIDRQRLAMEKQYQYQRTLDFRVGEQCPMNIDPANRRNGEGGSVFRADFGKIVAKKTVKIPAKSGFDEDEQVDTFQIASAKSGLVAFGAKEMKTHDGKPFAGSVGDMVFLCFASATSHGSGSYLPAEFRDKVLGSGFASRIKGPPRIVSKTKWNPIHLVGRGLLRSVARDGRWPLDAGTTVLSHIFIERDLGGGRFEIRLDEPHSLGRPSDLTFLLEVPSGLKGHERLGTGEWVWAIMSRPVIDKQLRKLILTAEDLETSYVDAVDESK